MILIFLYFELFKKIPHGLLSTVSESLYFLHEIAEPHFNLEKHRLLFSASRKAHVSDHCLHQESRGGKGY